MNQIPWGLALAVFMGTLPLLGIMVWNLVDVRVLRSEVRGEFAQIRSELSLIRSELTKITERVAILEERERLTHPILKG